MEIYKKCFWISLMLLLGFQGCKKKDGAVQNSEIIPPIAEVGTRKLLPVQLGTGKSKVVISYTLQSAIQKVTHEDGRMLVVTYDQTGKPIELERFKNDEPVSGTSYELDEKGRVISGTTYKIKGNNYSQTGTYELDYNTENQVIKANYFDINNRKIAEQEKSYDATGNLSADKGGTLSLSYEYDLKNGLFKQSSYTWLLQLEKENNFFPAGMHLFLSGTNNIQLCNNLLSADMQQSFSYIFNKDGYPETINATIDGVKSAVKVVYKEL